MATIHCTESPAKLWLVRTFLIAAGVVALGCGGQSAPIAPTALSVEPTALCASGQSNMGDTDADPTRSLLPRLQAATLTRGWAMASQPIATWHVGAIGWTKLSPLLRPSCSGFIWLQGESDDPNWPQPQPGLPPFAYRAELADLFARVRALTSARLPMFVVEISSRFSQTQQEQLAACSADVDCTFIRTEDMAFVDTIHFEDYPALALRVMAAVSVHGGGAR